MRLYPLIAICAISTITGFGHAASVTEHFGNIEFHVDGTTSFLTNNGNNGECVLSPDGRTVAFIHLDSPSGSLTSLWIADGVTGKSRRLIGPKTDAEPQLNFSSFSGPIFSLDGGFVYVTASAWATSGAVHQVSIATGRERFVIDGNLISVIRTGPLRGFLLVGRHMYRPAPQYGSYDPVYVVKPDGKSSSMVPGTDQDDGQKSLLRWLRSHGWQAW